MPNSPETRARRQREQLALTVVTLNALKTAAGCKDCGYNDHPAALHFDHVDARTKLKELGWVDDRSKLFTRGRLARFIDHVTKYCEIRCANCHAVRSVKEQHWRPRGTYTKAETLF